MTGVALAHSTGATFIRGNFAGAYITDVGFTDTDAAEAARLRSALGADSIRFIHNLNPSMGNSLLGKTAVEEARGALVHCLVDGFTVPATSSTQASPQQFFRELRRCVPNAPLIVGRGATHPNISQLLAIADGVIVVSCFRREGNYLEAIEVERVREFMSLVRHLRSSDLRDQGERMAGFPA